MGLSRYANTRDENEAEIVDVLTDIGATVVRLNLPGVPDCLVGYRGLNYLLEIKSPVGPRGGVSGSQLTPEQEKWFKWWRGQRRMIRGSQEGLKVIRATR